jgi:hypothetical protein
MRGGSNLATSVATWISPKLCRKVTDVTCHHLPCDVLSRGLDLTWGPSVARPRGAEAITSLATHRGTCDARSGSGPTSDCPHRHSRALRHASQISQVRHTQSHNHHSLVYTPLVMHARCGTHDARCMTIAAQLLLSAALLMSRFASHRSPFALGTSHAST